MRLRAATTALLLEDSRVSALLTRMGSPQIETAAAEHDEASSSGAARAPPVQREITGSGSRRDLGGQSRTETPHATTRAGGSVSTRRPSSRPAATARSRPTARRSSELAASGARTFIVFTPAWEPPLLELLDFLAELRRRVGAGAAIVVTAGARRAARGERGRARHVDTRRRAPRAIRSSTSKRVRAHDPPRFAIVGHPNKGKSSIVATLAEDDAVAISPHPGTTTRARAYPMRLDGEMLYELIDTPGFQRARETLTWLESHDRGAGARAAVVREFVHAHAADPRFHDECELLQPIVDGAGILYVVDGSRPYGRQYEPEMEVLRWTGRPRMALINLIGKGDHIEEWRAALAQYFSIVRVVRRGARRLRQAHRAAARVRRDRGTLG